MAHLHRCDPLNASRRGRAWQPSFITAAVAKASKGFGKSKKQKEDVPKKSTDSEIGDKQVLREATAAATGREKYRPVRAEEASRGKLDYVQVADWGDGDRSKLGDLRLVSHVPQYEGGDSGGGGGGSGGGEDSRRPFHMQLARQLKLAEARGALAVAGPPPPPLSEWSFREGRYAQFLADQLEVHRALEAALQEATGAAAPPGNGTEAAVPQTGRTAGSFSASFSASASPSAAQPSSTDTRAAPPTNGDAATTAAAGATTTTSMPAAAVAAAPTAGAPRQCALQALRHLAPGRLGLERSAALQRDLTALLATVGHPAAVEARASYDHRRPQELAAAPLEPEALARPQPQPQPQAQPQPQVQAQGRQPVEAEVPKGWGQGTAGAGSEQPERREAAVAGSASGATRAGAQRHEPSPSRAQVAPAPGPMARSYAQVLRRLGRVSVAGESERERQAGALRLLAHAAVLHLVGQAAGLRVGAAATERLALLQRRAAATYHEYPEAVADPQVTLSQALDTAGQHLSSPIVRQVVFDELPSAMQKTSMLMTALAHQD